MVVGGTGGREKGVRRVKEGDGGGGEGKGDEPGEEGPSEAEDGTHHYGAFLGVPLGESVDPSDYGVAKTSEETNKGSDESVSLEIRGGEVGCKRGKGRTEERVRSPHQSEHEVSCPLETIRDVPHPENCRTAKRQVSTS